mgnify:CR=1 FL=1
MHTKLTPSRGLFLLSKFATLVALISPRSWRSSRHARSAHLATLVEALQSLQTTQVRNYTTFAIKRRGGNPRASGSKLEHT